MDIVFRLDDFSHDCNFPSWNRVLEVLQRNSIRVCVGVIPSSEDASLAYSSRLDDSDFWSRVRLLESQGNTIAMHGYRHVYHDVTNARDLVIPINKFSEFAGLNKEAQSLILLKSIELFSSNRVKPEVFMAPAHAFDWVTVEALLSTTSIRYITDGMSYRCFRKNGIKFIPQQFGSLRKPRFSFNTYCLHPNTMSPEDVDMLEQFIAQYRQLVRDFSVYRNKDFEEMNYSDLVVEKSLIGMRALRSKLF